MFASKKRQGQALATLKVERTYKQTKQLIADDFLFHLRTRVCGRVHATRWDDVYGFPQVPKSRDWVQELGWLAHSFLSESKLLNRFLELSKDFGDYFMLGDFAAADSRLAEVERQTGYSFWLAEQQFLLFQAREGFDDHKAHLAKLQTAISDPIVGYLITMLSNRLEPHVTPEAYAKNVSSALAEVVAGGRSRLAGLLELQISPWTFDWTRQAHDMLHLCSNRVLVDRFLLARKIVANLDPGVLKESQIKQLEGIFCDLTSAISDPFLTRIGKRLLSASPSSVAAPSSEYLAALDKYWSGQFDAAVAGAESLVRRSPSVFSYYWLLARAAACANSQSTLPFDAKCPASRILRALQAVAENSLQLEVFLIELNAVAFKLGDSALGIRLWQFSERELTGNTNSLAQDYAKIACEIRDLEDGNPADFPATLVSEHVGLAAIRLRGDHDSSDSNVDERICPHFRRILEAERSNRKGNFQDALERLQPFLDSGFRSTRLGTYLSGDIANLQFAAEVGLGRPEDAALSVVTSYVTNRNALRHVYFEELVQGGRNGRWPHLKSTPYFPILVWLDDGDEQDVYEAVDDLLLAMKLSSPRELIGLLDTWPQPVARLMLRDVLTAPVLMRGALWAGTPEEQRQIRTEILRKLFAISIEDQALVVDELAAVEHLRLLEDAYRNVEGPKFSLNFTDYNRTLASYLQGAFERYTAYRAYEEKGGQLTDESALLEQATGTAPKSGSEKRTETSEVLLSNLSLTVFVEYIWNSQKGVNATLSTRIRHGSLENQLKRVFGAHHLLATKDLKNNYQCDKVILNILETCDRAAQQTVEQAFVTFTIELNRIYERLLSKLKFHVPPGITTVLQQLGAGTELASEDGILDVGELFSQSTLDRLRGSNPRSIASLLAELQNIFTGCLQSALEKVRVYIRTSVASDILAAITQLDEAVACTLQDGWERAQLRNEVLAAKDVVTSDLKIIETWFSLADRAQMGSNSIKKLFATAVRVVQFASNQRLGTIVDSLPRDYEVAAEEGVVLYEVLSILLRNVVQHSGLGVEQRVRYSYHVAQDNSRVMEISNLLKDPQTCESAVREAVGRLSAPQDHRVLDRAPGGTGLRRIQALLRGICTREIVVVPSIGEDPKEFTVRIVF